MPPLPPRRAPELARLALIRVSMLAGVLTFGAVVWFLRRSGNAPPLTEAAATLRVVGAAVALFAAAGIATFRVLAGRAREPEQRLVLSIGGWAVGEAAALYGGFYYYATGRPLGYMLGLMILLVSFVFIPVTPRRR